MSIHMFNTHFLFFLHNLQRLAQFIGIRCNNTIAKPIPAIAGGY